MYVLGPSLDLVYNQASGWLYLADDEDARASLARGYSGHGSARNDPDQEAAASFGPIPRGMWRLEAARHHPLFGPCSIPLQPVAHKAHGRSGFYIHGDNAARDGSASHGCIILDRATREAIRALGVKTLLVV